MISLIDELNKFIDYQNALWEEFCIQNSNLNDFVMLLDFPRNGKITVDCDLWKFQKHGAGIKFIRENKKPEIIIDMTKYINRPDIFNIWRFLLYLESINFIIDSDVLLDEIKKMVNNRILIEVVGIKNYYSLNKS